MSHAQLPNAPLPSEAGGTPLGVLVVDDEPMIRELASRTLERNGYRVFAAEHGRAAIEMMERSAPGIGLVVLDLTMPGLSGDQTLAVLHARWPAARVVLMSGHNMRADDKPRPGVVGYVEKPYLPHELLHVVEVAIGS